jgi:hypothetical protein
MSKSVILCVFTFLLLSLISFIPQVNSNFHFSPIDRFVIPTQNSNISFAVDGTYENKSFEGNTWWFVNLHLSGSDAIENFKVSAKDSNVTIVSYQLFNLTNLRARLRYTVIGNGEQTLNLGLKPKNGDWEVRIDNEYVSENNGWHLSTDNSLTVTSSKYNVTIYLYSNSALEEAGSIRPGTIYDQHSIVIVVTVIFAVTLCIGVILKRTAKKQEADVSKIVPFRGTN